jgi:Alpha/beta hydrolase domain
MRNSIVGFRALALLLSPSFVVLGGFDHRLSAQHLPIEGMGRATAIGTEVGDIRTNVTNVTVSMPSRLRRLGLDYEERRGEIEGVGWGGTDINNARTGQHYTYRVSYVLRIPPGWDGTLVVFRHGAAPMRFWLDLEQRLGPRNTGRFFHEVADRFVSDVALDTRRRWAFFAVNQTPVDANGQFTTFLNPEEPGGGTPVQTMADVPIARDTTRVGQQLLKWLRGRHPTVTLGVGHSGGALVNLKLNTGVDPNNPGVLAGDNHVKPYDPASGKIYDGFMWLSGGPGGGGGIAAPIDPLRGVSAPTLLLAGEAETPALLNATRHVKDLIDAGVDPQPWTRVYAIRNMPHIDSDLVIALGRQGLDFAAPAMREHFTGGGERLKPVSAALLDALEAWITEGTSPPPSRFNGIRLDANGDGTVDALTFPQASGQTTSSFAFVDDPAQDVLSGPRSSMTAAQNPLLLSQWLGAQDALLTHPDSLVLAETACRRGRFSMVTSGPTGTRFTPYSEQEFFERWGSSAAHQSCRVSTADALIEQGFYDPTVVAIDIAPETFPNVINLAADDVVMVSIFSTSGFDATTINPATLGLGGASLPGDDTTRRGHDDASHHVARTRIEDVNGDGRLDMVAEFPVARLKFNDHDIVAELWGQTKQGIPFSGTDLVQLVR